MPIALSFQIFLVLAVALFAAAAILYHFGDTRGGKKARARAMLRETEKKIVFLFDGEDLVDASLPAQDLLSSGRGELSEWDHLQVALTPYFPDIRSQLASVFEAGKKKFWSADTPGLELLAESWDGMVRIVLNSRDDMDAETWIEKVRIAALESEAQTLRGVAEDSPNLIWIEDSDGSILWTNQAYASLADAIEGEGAPAKTWPPARLFDGTPDLTPECSPVTVKLPLSSAAKTETRWFEVTSSLRDD
jgi:PAS domain-containing protein